jgi:hypothetical protein
VIGKPVFSFYLTNEDQQSFVQIGDYTTQYLKDPNNMIWLKSPADYFWSSTVSGFRVGDFSNNKNSFVSPKAFKINSYKAIFDTATSLVYVP